MEYEFYALGRDRSVDAARSFLNHYVPRREMLGRDFSIPECSDEPRLVLNTEEELLRYLEVHRDIPYGLYWRNADGGTRSQAMLFYTRDGAVILGLTIETENPEEQMKGLFDAVGATHARFGWEERPPDTSSAFLRGMKDE